MSPVSDGAIRARARSRRCACLVSRSPPPSRRSPSANHACEMPDGSVAAPERDLPCAPDAVSPVATGTPALAGMVTATDALGDGDGYGDAFGDGDGYGDGDGDA